MLKHTLHFPPSPITQTVLDTGRGRALHITLSHNESTTQATRFYDRDGVLLAEYLVHPMNCPYTITFSNRDAFSFENGLQVNTGSNTLNLVIIY